MDYKQKYLKYKQKYLKLKAIYGGAKRQKTTGIRHFIILGQAGTKSLIHSIIERCFNIPLSPNTDIDKILDIVNTLSAAEISQQLKDNQLIIVRHGFSIGASQASHNERITEDPTIRDKIEKIYYQLLDILKTNIYVIHATQGSSYKGLLTEGKTVYGTRYSGVDLMLDDKNDGKGVPFEVTNLGVQYDRSRYTFFGKPYYSDGKGETLAQYLNTAPDDIKDFWIKVTLLGPHGGSWLHDLKVMFIANEIASGREHWLTEIKIVHDNGLTKEATNGISELIVKPCIDEQDFIDSPRGGGDHYHTKQMDNFTKNFIKWVANGCIKAPNSEILALSTDTGLGMDIDEYYKFFGNTNVLKAQDSDDPLVLFYANKNGETPFIYISDETPFYSRTAGAFSIFNNQNLYKSLTGEYNIFHRSTFAWTPGNRSAWKARVNLEQAFRPEYNKYLERLALSTQINTPLTAEKIVGEDKKLSSQ
jgi:hypothetical protein